MNKAYRKDIFRSIKNGWKRFLSIMIITALGVAMLTGLYAACLDMYYSADKFYDQQNLFDIRILSTLGLTQDDIDEISQIEGTAIVEGAYSETVNTEVDGTQKSAQVNVLSSEGLNIPELLDGKMPAQKGEIAVTQKYLDESGKVIGDTLTIEEDIEKIDEDTDKTESNDDIEVKLKEEEKPTFNNTEYKITGVVLDPMDIQNSVNGVPFRSSADATDYTFFVTNEDVDSEIFTAVYIILAGTKDMNCYSEEYKNAVQKVIDDIENKIKAKREQARYDEILVDAKTKIADAEKIMNTKFAEVDKEIADAWEKINNAKQELSDNEEMLNLIEMANGVKMVDAWEEIAQGKKEVEDAENELVDEEKKYKQQKEDAQKKIADAYAELDDIDMTQWYVQDRTSLESYSSLDSDLSSIESVGKVFPVLFLLVAVLISLTTMTRMVEEERGLIGVYKALGYSNKSIYIKYIWFALIACILGGVLGDVLGFVFMPKFVEVILAELYIVPAYYLRFDAVYGVGGVILFLIAIVGSTIIACRNELARMPAVLMRPKAPRSGSRVFLERIKPIWNRLKFLNKVTARNLFRYKKRLFMTIGGIAGCTALILCGFAIKDSITGLKPKQYENTYKYDLMAVFEEKDNDPMVEKLADDSNINDYINLRIDNVKVINSDGKSEKVQLIIIPDGKSLENYIHTEKVNGKLAKLDDTGVLITQNAARMLGVKSGDEVAVQDMKLVQHSVTLSAVVKNYLGNNIYMTEGSYKQLFGDYKPNAVLANLSNSCADQATYTEKLLDEDAVLSTVSIEALEEDFGFDLINAVVLLLIVLAGGLAFVVLFTLSNTNISERERELATIKVLGFYDKEVHQYVNKETKILTIVGIIIGLPLGRIISEFLTVALNMPSMHFAVQVEPLSYLISAVITFCFAVVVNLITNRALNKINMVEALKSVE